MSPPLFSRLWRNLLYGFRRELRPYEAAVFEHALGASSAQDQQALRQQLESRERVQRWTDRVLYFGLPAQRQLPRISVTTPDYCYAAVKLTAPGGKVTARFMTHRGLLSTIEFSKVPVPLLSGTFTVQEVELHPGGTGYAENLDEQK